MNSNEIDAYFADTAISPTFNQYLTKGHKIHYAEVGSDTSQMVIFFHGAPGSWTAFIDFMKDPELINTYRIISVDRPGYGYSNFGVSEPSLSRQADILEPILKLNQSKKLPIIIGHSLGGPVVAKLAIKYPELVGSIIMVAPSIDPQLEPYEPWRGPLRSSILNWLVPRSLRVTNDEIFYLKKQLDQMMVEWSSIKVPVIVIQGGKDLLVHPGNAEFAKNMIINAPVEIRYYKDVDHFIPWSNPQLIKSAIYDIDK